MNQFYNGGKNRWLGSPLGATTFATTTFGATAFGATAVGTTTFSRTTVSQSIKIETLSKTNAQGHEQTYYAECR